jgi:hypothetical protein
VAVAGGEAAARGDGQERAVRASGRLGFAARAVLYAMVGALAFRLAIGVGSGDEASQQGAMEALAQRPFGGTLLAAVAVGLAAYALFRLSQAVRGRGDGGVLSRRVSPAVRAVVNGGLSALAFQELLGAGEGSSESGVTAAVLRMPGGTWLVVALGVVVIAVGVKQFVDAWKGDTDELTRAGQVPARARGLARATGRAGYVGRGVVFVLVGGFLVRAAVRHDPESGVGLDAALQELLDAPFGSPLLIAVAIGLILFGLHCAVEARYSR